MTLDEVAVALGVSHQRVSQLEQSALKKVRIELLKRGINYEDLKLCLKLWV
jgi:DNA-directed RNA polymerase sigma subunit (sigma70/sigma32)